LQHVINANAFAHTVECVGRRTAVASVATGRSSGCVELAEDRDVAGVVVQQ